MSKQTFVSADVSDFPPASHTAVGNTVTRTNLWVPGIWTPIPALDVRAGKTYHLRCGGIISATAAPTIIFNPTFGSSTTPGSNVALGASTTFAVGTVTNAAWYAEFIVGFRQIGVAASGATATGNGIVVISGAAAAISQVVVIGSTVPTNIDQTTTQGMCLDVTWGTAAVGNTITAQWTFLQSCN
jgi:hypothetical protein